MLSILFKTKSNDAFVQSNFLDNQISNRRANVRKMFVH